MDARRVRKHFGLKPARRGRIELANRGLSIEWIGAHGGTLSHLMDDLERAWQSRSTENVPVARVYGESGAGARDPRTGITAPRLRDVLRGKLDRFLEAWREQAAAVSSQ
jgi:hypothetical protein